MTKPLNGWLAIGALLFCVMTVGAAWAGDERTAIHADANDVQPLLPGMMAPAFTARTVEDQPFEFDPSAMEKPVVMTFFRGGWCPYCNMHLAEMRKAEAELKDMGFEVWFLSMDQPSQLVSSLQDPEIGYTMLSDARAEATRAFGIAFRVDDATIERYQGYGIDLEAASGETHHALPVPATFIVGQDGVINFTYANPSYTVRLHPDVLLAAARAYTADADARLKRDG